MHSLGLTIPSLATWSDSNTWYKWARYEVWPIASTNEPKKNKKKQKTKIQINLSLPPCNFSLPLSQVFSLFYLISFHFISKVYCFPQSIEKRLVHPRQSLALIINTLSLNSLLLLLFFFCLVIQNRCPQNDNDCLKRNIFNFYHHLWIGREVLWGNSFRKVKKNTHNLKEFHCIYYACEKSSLPSPRDFAVKIFPNIELCISWVNAYQQIGVKKKTNLVK